MTSANVVHLPESSAAPWPGESTYRPPGWRSKLAPGEIGPRLAVVTSLLEEDWENAKLITERKRLEEHVTLLRQMWVTREWVWRMAEALVGPPELDPFWHPWSHVHRLWGGVRLLDGNEGRDGFDLSLWGRVGIVDASKPGLPTIDGSTRGRTAYVNGPHGDTARYVETCTRAARAKHKVAAVVALDGCGWFAGNTTAKPLAAPDATGILEAHVPTQHAADVLSCDLLCVPEERRMSFEPPPGVPPSSPTKGYALAVWGATMDDARRLAPTSIDRGGAVRVTVAGHRWVILPGCGDAG